MSSKSFKMILIFISIIFLTEFIMVMIAEGCPPGHYYFKNSTHDEDVTTVEPSEDENNCHNCSLKIPMCDYCLIINLTEVICHNCTRGRSPSPKGDACLKVDHVDHAGFRWWGGLLIFLGIVGVIAGALVGYFCWKKQHKDNLPLPNIVPDPDGLNKGGRVKKKKFNKYTKDPTMEEKASVSYSNRNVEANEPVEEVRVENEEVKVKGARVKVQPDKPREGSHLYENFGSATGGKIRSHYPKNDSDDIYQNV